MRSRWLTLIRRTVQFLVLLILLLSPLFQIVRTFRQNPYPFTGSPILQSEFLLDLLMKYDHILRPPIEWFSERVSGGPYSFHFFGFHFSEPLTATVYSLISPLEISSVGALTLLFVAILIVLVGRGYCGYVCPMSLLVSFNLKVRRFFRLRPPKYSGSIDRRNSVFQKFYQPIMILFIVVNPAILQYVLPPALMQHAWSDIILTGHLTLWVGILVVVLAVEIGFPAFFCRRLCPTGIFLSYVGSIKRLRLHHVSGVQCEKGCFNCNRDCWLGLNPKKIVDDPSCDMCGRCIPACPTRRMSLTSKVAKNALVVLVLLSLTNSEPLQAGIWNEKELYHQKISEKTYFESHKKLNATHTAFYSIFGNTNTELGMHLHVRKEVAGEGDTSKIRFQIHDSPLTIRIKKGGEILKELKLEKVNYPISITTRSSYFLNFSYRLGDELTFEVESHNNEFPRFDFQFIYPRNRY